MHPLGFMASYSSQAPMTTITEFSLLELSLEKY